MNMKGLIYLKVKVKPKSKEELLAGATPITTPFTKIEKKKSNYDAIPKESNVNLNDTARAIIHETELIRTAEHKRNTENNKKENNEVINLMASNILQLQQQVDNMLELKNAFEVLKGRVDILEKEKTNGGNKT